MVRTIASIIISFAIIFGLSFYEVYYVRTTFKQFHDILDSLYQKTESYTATYEDGTAVRMLWEKEKRKLYFWLSHTVIENIDYQLNESLGYLYEGGYQDALPKLEILIKMSEYIPDSYSLNWENII